MSASARARRGPLRTRLSWLQRPPLMELLRPSCTTCLTEKRTKRTPAEHVEAHPRVQVCSIPRDLSALGLQRKRNLKGNANVTKEGRVNATQPACSTSELPSLSSYTAACATNMDYTRRKDTSKQQSHRQGTQAHLAYKAARLPQLPSTPPCRLRMAFGRKRPPALAHESRSHRPSG